MLNGLKRKNWLLSNPKKIRKIAKEMLKISLSSTPAKLVLMRMLSLSVSLPKKSNNNNVNLKKSVRTSTNTRVKERKRKLSSRRKTSQHSDPHLNLSIIHHHFLLNINFSQTKILWGYFRFALRAINWVKVSSLVVKDKLSEKLRKNNYYYWIVWLLNKFSSKYGKLLDYKPLLSNMNNKNNARANLVFEN